MPQVGRSLCRAEGQLVEVSGMLWLLLSLLKEATPCASERNVPVHIRKRQFLFKSHNPRHFHDAILPASGVLLRPLWCWLLWEWAMMRSDPEKMSSEFLLCLHLLFPSPTDTCRWHMSSQLCAQPLLRHGWSHLLPNTGLPTSVGEPPCLWIKWTSNLP